MLTEIVDEYGLVIANDLYDEQTWNDKWTFKSSLGMKRQIDFILAGLDVHVCQSRAVDSLDLGSDHRAQHIEFPVLRTMLRDARILHALGKPLKAINKI